MTEARLEIQQAWWAMEGLGDGEKEWTMEEKFEKIAEAGFTGIVGFVPASSEAEQWRKLLDRYRFSFGALAFPWNRQDLSAVAKQAKEFGAQYINAQVMDAYVIGAEAERLLNDLVMETREQEVPLYVETHRGRVTQDLHRTIDYVNAIPDLRLTIDLSHYIVAGEINGDIEKVDPYFDILLKRTSCLHARVSNGEQIQIDIGPNGVHPMVKHFMRWWTSAFKYWLEQAKPGESLPVLPELGPPDYAITTQPYLRSSREVSNRWEQASVLKQLLQQAWQRAKSAKF
ncbi:sugar phosphate isomerase/epimerase family protein [Paenibacillus sp. Soil787]|uniref:sugar phosphate isomerase/epimerase family protein n=1 Tax=Paenibacillus sp. Soil787 TaxID=1736411 RepID=UPI0007C640C6|nr:TIM barrel protein [Paenibacillus sp. Soil787]